MNEETTNTVEEAVEVPAKKPRAKRIPNRSIDELNEVPARKMTDSEKELFINELREQNMLIQNKYDNLEATAHSLNNLYKEAAAKLEEYKTRQRQQRERVRTILNANAFALNAVFNNEE